MTTVTPVKLVFTREGKSVNEITIEIPGPVEPFDRASQMGAARTDSAGGRRGMLLTSLGLHPLWQSFSNSKQLLNKLRDAPPEGMGVPVYPRRYPVNDEGDMALNIKAMARYLGADLVGLVKLTPERIRVGAYLQEQEEVSKFTHCIVVATEMDALRFRTRLIHPNFPRPVRAPSASADVHKTYSDVEKTCVHLADYVPGSGL